MTNENIINGEEAINEEATAMTENTDNATAENIVETTGENAAAENTENVTAAEKAIDEKTKKAAEKKFARLEEKINTDMPKIQNALKNEEGKLIINPTLAKDGTLNYVLIQKGLKRSRIWKETAALLIDSGKAITIDALEWEKMFAEYKEANKKASRLNSEEKAEADKMAMEMAASLLESMLDK